MNKKIINIIYTDCVGNNTIVFANMIQDLKIEYKQNKTENVIFIPDIEGSMTGGILHLETTDYLFIINFKDIAQEIILRYIEIIKRLNPKTEEK